MIRFLALAILTLAVPSAAQTTSGVFSNVSLGPNGAPLVSSANFVEVTDAGVYASGLFLAENGHFDVSVKRWTGNGWVRVGDLRGDVHALDSAPDGTLYAVGPRIGESNLSRWDGEAWHAAGFGTEAVVTDVSVAPDGTVAVVAFGAWPSEVYTVRLFENGAWHTLGAPLAEQPTDLVIVSADEVYVSGTSGVRRWNGTAWTDAGGTFDGVIRAMALTDAGLVAVGEFTSIGTVPAAYVAGWNGVAWVALGGGLSKPAARVSASAGQLAALTRATDDGPFVLGLWDGVSWEVETVPVNSYARGIAVTGAGEVYVAGSFFTAAFGELSAVHHRTEIGWSPLGSAVNGRVTSFAQGDGSGPVMAGRFSTVGSVEALRVAEWTDDGWRALSGDLPRTYYSEAMLLRGENGRLYAGGRFVVDGGYQPVLVRDGADWVPVGPHHSGNVNALITDAGGSLVRAIGLDDGSAVVQRWDGAVWQSLGGVFESGVLTLALAPDGALCAGGHFMEVGAVVTGRAACLRDGVWQPIGAPLATTWGFGEAVYALAFGADGTPYAGGIALDGADVGFVRWTGTEWASVPGTPFSNVLAMTTHPDGALYASGTFTSGQGTQRLLSSWDGETWWGHGQTPDLPGSIQTLWVDAAGSVWAGGDFDMIGGVHSPNVIRFDPAPPTAGSEPLRSNALLPHVVPNPARGAARLTATVPEGVAEVSVYDALGRRVALAFNGETTGALSVPLDLAGLAPGVYVVRVRTADGVETTRFTVAR